MRRARYLSQGTHEGQCVVYWMSRDQRTQDNWALWYAQQEAEKRQQPLLVVFHLEKSFLHAQDWHFSFLCQGLQEVEQTLFQLNIPFLLSRGTIQDHLIPLLKQLRPSLVVTDFDPLRIKREWKLIVSQAIPVSMIEVDTHNIVPCWIASDKQEFGARTLRPKIHRLLSEFLTDIPQIHSHPYRFSTILPPNEWPHLALLPPLSPTPGEKAAWEAFLTFFSNGIHRYAQDKNLPLANATSRLSAYFHFGQLSPQRVAYEISQSETISLENKNTFLEELIIRRELSDNFVFYQKNYDNWDGIPAWAKRSLNKHRDDPRPFLYTLETLESAQTHDPLWNACQKSMKKTGYLHGYLRMYWAKKILEWSLSPEEAIEKAIYLNDHYFLDGRDPNGYTGILWSIGGLHDRPFSERPIIGQIRPMTASGCERKFSTRAFIDWVEYLPEL